MRYFSECPDCQSSDDPIFERECHHYKVEDIPRYTQIIPSEQLSHKETLGYIEALPTKKILVQGRIRAYCGVCGWTTDLHDTVKECSDEWNSTRIGERT